MKGFIPNVDFFLDTFANIQCNGFRLKKCTMVIETAEGKLLSKPSEKFDLYIHKETPINNIPVMTSRPDFTDDIVFEIQENGVGFVLIKTFGGRLILKYPMDMEGIRFEQGDEWSYLRSQNDL